MLKEGNARYGLIIICLIGLAVILSMGVCIGETDSGEPLFNIVTDYPGMNAEEVEHTITTPLEHELSSLQDLVSITAASDYSRSTIVVRGKRTIEQTALRSQIRDKITRASETFPRAVRKPRITTSDSSRTPIYVVAATKHEESLEAIGKFAEREIKPRYSGVHGVGEVMITGSTHDEISVHVDAKKSVLFGVHPLNVADAIARANTNIPCGSIVDDGLNIPIVYKCGILDETGIAAVRIASPSGKTLQVSDLCVTRRRHAIPDRIGRVNGERGILIAVYPGIGTNTVSLCRDLSSITRSLQRSGLTLQEIHNQGIKDRDKLRATGLSLLVGLTIIAAFLALSLDRFAYVMILASLLPMLLLMTVALLTVLRITIDTGILAGLSIGSGMAVDNYLVVQTKISEHIDSSSNKSTLTSIRKAIAPLISPLIATTITTIIVFIPLRLMRESSSFLSPLSMTLSLMLLISLPLAFLCLPRPLHSLSNVHRLRIHKKNTRFPNIIDGSSRVFLLLAKSSNAHSIPYAIACGALIVASIYLITLSEREVSPLSQESVVFIHVETGAGCSIDETDARVTTIIDTLSSIPGTISTEADSRRENASILLRYDPSAITRDEYERAVRSSCKRIRYAQLFPSISQSSSTMKTTLTVTGHHRPMLRKITMDAGAYFSKLPWVKGVIYRFREGSPMVSFSPERDSMCKAGIQTRYAANLLTWSIQGPVASKILSKGTEIDIRVFGTDGENLNSMRNAITIDSNGKPIPLSSVGNFVIGADAGKLYRSGRQNSLSFTIETERMGLSRLTKLLETSLADLNTPTGFFILPDPQLSEAASEYRSMTLALAFACFLVYAVLVAQTASFAKPLLIMASVPLSAFLPLIALRLCDCPISPAVFIALVMLSGMAVNNSILILDSIRATSADSLGSADTVGSNACLSAVRSRYPALFLTSATTILSSIPVAITSRGFSSFPGTLALVAGLGTLGSFLTSFMFIPAVYSLLRRSSPPSYK